MEPTTHSATTSHDTTGPEPTPTGDHQATRRATLFRWATYALGGLASAVVGLPIVGYVLGSKRQGEQWVPLGRAEDFDVGETRLVMFENPIRQPWDGLAAMTGVYVRRPAPDDGDTDKFRIFAINCAHLGCPVEWFPQSGLFMCPCHGGVYHANGDRASGPPPRGLYQCAWREKGGELQLRAPHYPSLQDTEKSPT